MDPFTIISLALAGVKTAAEVYDAIRNEPGTSSQLTHQAGTAVSLAVDLYDQLRRVWAKDISPAEIARLDAEYQQIFAQSHWKPSGR